MRKLNLCLFAYADALALLIREQNAGLIVRKMTGKSVFESFEVSAKDAAVMGAKGKLLCSYPGPAIALQQCDVDDPAFRGELASFLVHMNVDVLDSAPTYRKANTIVVETRDTAHPRYITELLTGILRGMGEVADVTRIQKRIADDIVWKKAKLPWRRSPLWLVIRVALQTTLHDMTSGHIQYKSFMMFLMARILRVTVEHELPSDLLFCMRAKISRRLFKLGSLASPFVAKEVYEAGQLIEEVLHERWSMVQLAQPTRSRNWALNELAILRDTSLSLLKSKDSLGHILTYQPLPPPSYVHKPNLSNRILTLRDFGVVKIRLLKALEADRPVALADFECVVQLHLDNWVERSLGVTTACATLADCLTQYLTAASMFYSSNPEQQSLMLLTIFQLWIAIDKIATTQFPLLLDYSPEIPSNILEPLILKKSDLFARARIVEDYLKQRHNNSHSNWTVFTDKVNSQTLSVRYFDQSTTHQTLMQRIENDAVLAREAKLRELRLKSATHQTLLLQASSMVCEYKINIHGRKKHKSKTCQKCVVTRQAAALEIAVHEWPLPKYTPEEPHNALRAKAVVFELNVPHVFGVWRTTTFQILYDIATLRVAHAADPLSQLDTYHGFESYTKNIQIFRITWASETKSFLNSHYRTKKFPTNEASVCVPNALRFRLYDRDKNVWVATAFTECSISRYCTSPLPSSGPYSGLQYAVDGTSHTSNQIISSQFECPVDLNAHEYHAFAGLRSGGRLQWLNIARELHARSLSFSKEEVHTLLTQAAWQIGPSSPNGDRQWHTELADERFSLLLLNELQGLLTNVKASWLEEVSVRTIIVLTTRILASSSSTQVTAKVYSLLRKARDVAFGWMNLMSKKLRETQDEHKMREFRQRLCEVVTTCRSTYDVDSEHIINLISSPQDVAVLVICAIVLYDNTPTTLADIPPELKMLLYRDRRLSHFLEPWLCRRVCEDRIGLDQAITAIWTGYRPGSEWQKLTSPNDRWLASSTRLPNGQISQYVHLNLLEGRLLINGKPLGRLPLSILNNPLYIRLFGKVRIISHLH